MFISKVETTWGRFAALAQAQGFIRIILPNEPIAEDALYDDRFPWDFSKQLNDYFEGKRV